MEIRTVSSWFFTYSNKNSFHDLLFPIPIFAGKADIASNPIQGKGYVQHFSEKLRPIRKRPHYRSSLSNIERFEKKATQIHIDFFDTVAELQTMALQNNQTYFVSWGNKNFTHLFPSCHFRICSLFTSR